MTHTGVIVMLDGSNGVVQSGQQIVLDIAHIGGFLLQTLKDIFQMAAAESEQLIPHQFSGQFLARDGEILRFGAQDFHDLSGLFPAHRPLVILYRGHRGTV